MKVNVTFWTYDGQLTSTRQSRRSSAVLGGRSPSTRHIDVATWRYPSEMSGQFTSKRQSRRRSAVPGGYSPSTRLIGVANGDSYTKGKSWTHDGQFTSRGQIRCRTAASGGHSPSTRPIDVATWRCQTTELDVQWRHHVDFVGTVQVCIAPGVHSSDPEDRGASCDAKVSGSLRCPKRSFFRARRETHATRGR